jgi:hypothetical protein
MRIAALALFALFLPVVVVALAGCGKEAVPSTTEKPNPKEPPKSNPPAEPAYAIKVREKQPGEKYDVTQLVSVDFVKGDKGQPQSVKTNTAKTTYTEEVQEVKDGRVTKTKRAYGQADSLYAGEPVTLSFTKKTVLIERVGEKQVKLSLADGGQIGIDGAHLQSEFDRPADRIVQPLLPTTPVKVGEEWELSKDNLVAYLGQFAAPWKGSGKLTKVYAKDGKQYGVFTITAAFPSFRDEPPRETHEWTYDGCIDGSATDSTRKNLTITRIPEINGKKDATTPLNVVLETTYKQVK